MIDVYPQPVAAFAYSPVLVTVVNPVVSFTDQSTGADSWLWDFGDPKGDNNSILENPVHTYNDVVESYCILLTVGNTWGCKDTVSHCLEVGPDFEFYVPNAFTPNGDGKNDFFNGNGIGVEQYDMQIFDRWGLLIFETNSLSNSWNGCYGKSTTVCEQDVYVYKIVLTDVFKEMHNYVGTVTLLK
jgi:gliding motility-associated-like protein